MLAFRQTKATVSPGAFIPGRLRHALRENSVIRFLLAHLLTLGIVMMICASGFHSALDIVRQDILESSGFAMEQAVEAVTNRLVTLRIIGLQVINTDSIRELGSSSPQSSNYAFLAQRAVKDYTEYLLYHEETLDQSSFLYFQNLDRVLYRGSVYRPEVFRSIWTAGISMMPSGRRSAPVPIPIPVSGAVNRGTCTTFSPAHYRFRDSTWEPCTSGSVTMRYASSFPFWKSTRIIHC